MLVNRVIMRLRKDLRQGQSNGAVKRLRHCSTVNALGAGIIELSCAAINSFTMDALWYGIWHVLFPILCGTCAPKGQSHPPVPLCPALSEAGPLQSQHQPAAGARQALRFRQREVMHKALKNTEKGFRLDGRSSA